MHSRYYPGYGYAQPNPYSTGLWVDRLRRISESTSDSGSTSTYGDPNFREEVDYTRATYPRYVVVGWAHMVIGCFLIIIGLTDIGWTASKYEGGCDFEKDDTFNGCGTNNIYTYIAAPLWGGLVMIFVGILTFMMTPYRLMYNTWLLYVFLGGCFFILIAICPTIVTMSVLLITENKNMFWAEDGDRGIVLQDEARFAFAVVIIILALLDFLVAMVSILIGIFCPPQTETNFGKDPYASRSYRSYVDAPAPPVVIEEDRRSRRSRRNYPASVPEIIVSEEVVKPRPRAARSDAGRRSPPGRPRAPPLRKGDRIVHEERIRPGGSRTGSHYGDDVSYYSRDRRSRALSDDGYARSEDYYRGGRRGLTRSEYSEI